MNTEEAPRRGELPGAPETAVLLIGSVPAAFGRAAVLPGEFYVVPFWF